MLKSQNKKNLLLPYKMLKEQLQSHIKKHKSSWNCWDVIEYDSLKGGLAEESGIIWVVCVWLY